MAFTGLTVVLNFKSSQLEQTLKSNGCDLATSVTDEVCSTHQLIPKVDFVISNDIDKSEHIKNAKKLGVAIVKEQWVTDSVKAKKPLPRKNYLLVEPVNTQLIQN